ncbi:MBL fold metallo-hydrolase [Metabacillus malikii]|uniref:Glyoxylase-like metal-dependent hydrolase (Beta-lactamase superfamily II) n=1 Tax=Metabacillus malikii TaxID=1504265 RepID=A0ABT9ZDS9_9BACI|nr:MBL fold metallo-hydrolase [Metabacillus malikii]MDQ0230002.1 glyoxylase-like metal-dependent hydrolase (beta-lactamase superfamily II) [Metabacillus malikii]
MKKIGPLTIIEGKHNSKVPYSRSIFIETDHLLIDAGAERELLIDVDRQYGINTICNTHYHPDHTRYNFLFPNAKKLMNPVEYEFCQTVEGIAKQNGVYEEWGEKGIERWKKSIPLDWLHGLQEINGTYEYNNVHSYGNVQITFIHTPGHTKGFCCPFFPDLGVVYTGDYDMTSFGPWYNGSDGNINDFIKSGEQLLLLDAEMYITGHQKGIFKRDEFAKEMKKFLSIIYERDERIRAYIKQGLTFDEIAEIGIFYPKKALENHIYQTWERIGIRKHVERLKC